MSALTYEFREVVEQCRNLIDAHERRKDGYPFLALNEAQELAILRIRLDDLAEVEATRRAESS